MLPAYVMPVPQSPFSPALPSFFVFTAHINMHPRTPPCICRQFGSTIKNGTHKRLAEYGISRTKLTDGGGRSRRPLPIGDEGGQC